MGAEQDAGRRGEARRVHPCFAADSLVGRTTSGRAAKAHMYSRDGIAAEAGIKREAVGAASREGRLVESSIYDVVRFVLERRRGSLPFLDSDVDKALDLLASLRDRSAEGWP